MKLNRVQIGIHIHTQDTHKKTLIFFPLASVFPSNIFFELGKEFFYRSSEWPIQLLGFSLFRSSFGFCS